MCVWRVLWRVYKTAQDVGIVSKYCSFIPILFGWFFRNGKREDRWEGSPMGRCMVCKVRKYRTLLLTKKQTVCCKFKRFQVKLQIQPSNFHYRSRNCYTCQLHMLSCVESSHFMYNSPSNMIHTFSLSVHYTTWPWLLQFSHSVSAASFLSQ